MRPEEQEPDEEADAAGRGPDEILKKRDVRPTSILDADVGKEEEQPEGVHQRTQDERRHEDAGRALPGRKDRQVVPIRDMAAKDDRRVEKASVPDHGNDSGPTEIVNGVVNGDWMRKRQRWSAGLRKSQPEVEILVTPEFRSEAADPLEERPIDQKHSPHITPELAPLDPVAIGRIGHELPAAVV